LKADLTIKLAMPEMARPGNSTITIYMGSKNIELPSPFKMSILQQRRQFVSIIEPIHPEQLSDHNHQLFHFFSNTAILTQYKLKLGRLRDSFFRIFVALWHRLPK
jgi:hypothetical protein